MKSAIIFGRSARTAIILLKGDDVDIDEEDIYI